MQKASLCNIIVKNTPEMFEGEEEIFLYSLYSYKGCVLILYVIVR